MSKDKKEGKKSILSSSTSTKVATNKKSKKILLKLFIAHLTIYTGVSIGYAAFSPHNYEHREFKFTEYTASVLMQPTMELFADGKISYWYDWKDIKTKEIDKSVAATKIYSQSDTYKNYTNKYSLKNIFADFGKIQDSAVLEPKDYKGKWSLVYCLENESVCQKSNILITGKIKILVDTDIIAWGYDENNNLIPLNLVEYTKRDQYSAIPLI